MSENAIDKLRRVPLREVWVHEAHNFTQWLQDNIDVLNEAIGLSISRSARSSRSSTTRSTTPPPPA